VCIESCFRQADVCLCTETSSQLPNRATVYRWSNRRIAFFTYWVDCLVAWPGWCSTSMGSTVSTPLYNWTMIWRSVFSCGPWSTATYLDMRRRGIEVRAVRYEDLIARPLDVCRAVLKFCHLPASLAEQGVKAIDVDSQMNSAVANTVLKSIKDPELTPARRAELNQLLKQFGVPLIGDQTIIEGTLTWSQ